MRITADTNLLVRATIGDDPRQEEAAIRVLSGSELVAIPIAVFCEFAWVLKRSYGFSRTDIASAIRSYLSAAVVATDRPAAEAGLAVLDQGGDFADGAIASQGVSLGGVHFVSFDAAARNTLTRQGFATLSPLPETQ